MKKFFNLKLRMLKRIKSPKDRIQNKWRTPTNQYVKEKEPSLK